MESIEHIGLTLQLPEHGWLPVRLQLNAFVIGCSASHVLNDPLDEFLGAVESCQTPTGPGHRTCLWLEPDGYAIDLLPGSSPDRRIVRVSYDRDFVPPMWYSYKPMKVVFEGEADARLIAEALLSPVAELVDQMDAETLEWWRRRDSSDYTERIAAITGKGI